MEEEYKEIKESQEKLRQSILRDLEALQNNFERISYLAEDYIKSLKK